MSLCKQLITKKKTENVKKYGVLFNTDRNNYFYDMGTGKVAKLNKDEHTFLKLFLDENISGDEFETYVKSLMRSKAFNEMIGGFESEHLLQAPEIKTLNLLKPGETYEEKLKTGFNQLILELTGKCNFKCKYCIYNEEFDMFRNFNTEDMQVETAIKAINFALEHSGEDVSITFYGGEPLIRFDVLKECIEYTLAHKGNKHIGFSFTTNLSLVTDEIADYLAKVPNLSILGSLDGPEDVQNEYRVYANGTPTFRNALHGLYLLSKAFKNTNNSLNINAVFTPPYSFNKLNSIDSFFAGLPFLKETTQVSITYTSPGTLHNIKQAYLDEEDKYVIGDVANPLIKWAWDKYRGSDSEDYHTLAGRFLIDYMRRIHFRTLVNEPLNYYHMNGYCEPGIRRLYVTTNGNLMVCERIRDSPSLGNIHTGIDISSIKRVYIDEYKEKSLPFCSECWAIRMCEACYANFYTKDGIDISIKNKFCDGVRKKLRLSLMMYYTLLEESPQKLEVYKDMEAS